MTFEVTTAVNAKNAIVCYVTPCRLVRRNQSMAVGSDIVSYVESSWNVMAQGDAWEGNWRGNWRMEWVASTLHSTSEHGVSNTTTSDVHTSVASSRLNWRSYQFKWTRPFRRKMKSGFCACAITFQTESTHKQRSFARATVWKLLCWISQDALQR